MVLSALWCYSLATEQHVCLSLARGYWGTWYLLAAGTPDPKPGRCGVDLGLRWYSTMRYKRLSPRYKITHLTQ